jgi:peptidoglycan/xylan/chitin deacetylase (PgdA/CDA1 family)
MKFLRDNRYNVVGLDKVIEYLRHRRPVPPKTVAVTVDDGNIENYTYIYPILKKYNIPATIFVIIKKTGRPGWLGWNEIKEMSDSGLVTIGSHTVSHLWLPTMGTKDVQRELAESKRILEERIGKPVDFLCYPIGAQDERVRRLSREAGYRGAVATNPGRSSPASDVFAIKRIRISNSSDNLFVFWFESSGYYTFFKELKGQ